MKKVCLYTDGACSGNPGPGGWGSILVYGNIEKEISGGEKSTTNNQMELQAVIEGLKLLKSPCEVECFSDSQYVVKGVNEWLSGWKKNGWKTSTKKPVKNVEQWKEMDDLLKVHKVTLVWVKGHNGHSMNERCDTLAVIERDKNL